MERAATCPRCAREMTPPGVWSSDWECAEHGAAAPVHPAPNPTADWLRHVASTSRVPVWLPWPLPSGWVISGVGPVGDDVRGICAVATVLTGPSPFGGPAEMLLVAEEPGIGRGAHLAGLAGPDPGDVIAGEPYTRVGVDGHSVPMWLVPADADRAVAVGERDLTWMWFAVQPASAGALLVDGLTFTDAREIGEEVRLLPYGSRSSWLDPA
ncbi:MAG: DUF6758 family protein [Jiangellales bacterium]